MNDKFHHLRQALAALKLAGPVSTNARSWEAVSDALDVELVAELLAEHDAMAQQPAGRAGLLRDIAVRQAVLPGEHSKSLRADEPDMQEIQKLTRLLDDLPDDLTLQALPHLKEGDTVTCHSAKPLHQAQRAAIMDILRNALPTGVRVFVVDSSLRITAQQAEPARVPEDAPAEDMTTRWCWWLADSERFHIADTEAEAHGEAQSSIDDDSKPGQEHRYKVARVQHPMDSLGTDWIAEHVASLIEENVCLWCDDNTGAEEPSIMLAAEDKKALGVMVTGFLREKVGVDWWTSDQKTTTEHTYVAGSNDSPNALTAAQAKPDGGAA